MGGRWVGGGSGMVEWHQGLTQLQQFSWGLFQGANDNCRRFLEGKKDADHGSALNKYSVTTLGFAQAE